MKQYLDLLHKVYTQGKPKSDRTGTGTYSLFGEQLKFDLKKGFPLVTTKEVLYKSAIHELLWMIRGDTNIKYLKDNGVGIWDAWADERGYVGPLYGKQWRHWENPETHNELETDQLLQAIETIKTNPDCRRIIVSAWNVSDLPDMALAPCHCFFQFYVRDGELSCHVYLRSLDMFLGCPFDIVLYGLLTHMVAAECELVVDTLTLSIGDCHIYNNHLDQVNKQLRREPMSLPKLLLARHVKRVIDYTANDIMFIGYYHHDRIKAPISI